MTVKNKTIDVFFGNSAAIAFVLDADFPADFNASTDRLSWVLSTSQIGDVLVTKTLSAGVAVSGTTATITLDAADTKFSPSRYYYHELLLYRPDGGIKTLVSGVMRVRASVGSVYTPTP